MISGHRVVARVTPNPKTNVLAAASVSGMRRSWEELSSDSEDDAADEELFSGPDFLKKSGRMSAKKRACLLTNQDVTPKLDFTPLHYFGCFEDLDTSIVQKVVILLPSGVDTSKFKPRVTRNLLEFTMVVPGLMTRPDLLCSDLGTTGTEGAARMLRLVNIKNFIIKCLGQKKPGDEVLASCKIILPAPALDNKFTRFVETRSDDGAIVVTLEMKVEDAYIEGQVAAKKTIVKL